MHLNIKLLGFFEAPGGVEVGGEDVHIVVFVLEGKGDVDDQLLCTTDAEVWMDNGHSGFHLCHRVNILIIL